MKFADALELLKQGEKVKLPSWSGYWVKEDNTVKMYCKDGRVLDIREMEDVFYTLSNIASEEWCVAEDKEINLDVHTFMFGEAIRRLKAGQKVARKGWNGKGMFLYMQGGSKVAFHDLKEDVQRKLMNKHVVDDSGKVTINPHIDMKAADGSVVIGWIASQTDMLAEDWVIVE